MSQPLSNLTLERPDIWQLAFGLATALTRQEYVRKLPNQDGTLYAMYDYGPYVPPTPEEIEQSERRKIEQEIGNLEQQIEWTRTGIEGHKIGIEAAEKKLKELKDALVIKRRDLLERRRIGLTPVPEGAMEWLLHEVGHWVAATSEERSQPNYGVSPSDQGLDGDREWQAWAFEEIILAPFGPARSFTVPTQRLGVAFAKASGPIPRFALDHAEHQIQALGIDVERWRVPYAEWVQWGRNKKPGHEPWVAIG